MLLLSPLFYNPTAGSGRRSSIVCKRIGLRHFKLVRCALGSISILCHTGTYILTANPRTQLYHTKYRFAATILSFLAYIATTFLMTLLPVKIEILYVKLHCGFLFFFLTFDFPCPLCQLSVPVLFFIQYHCKIYLTWS